MTILTDIEKRNYVADEAQVEALARAHYENAYAVYGLGLAFLQIEVALMHAKIGRKTRGKQEMTEAQIHAQVAVLNEIHGRIYPAVLRGVTTPEVEDDPMQDNKERRRRSLVRNSRSNFARSAKSTLLKYIQAGGDVRKLEPGKVRKDVLREFTAANQPEIDPEKAVGRIKRQGAALLKRFRDAIEAGVAGVEGEVAALVANLQALTAPHTETVTKRTRAGRPVFRQPAEVRP